MKAISIKLEVPERVDEEKFAARLKRIAEKMIFPKNSMQKTQSDFLDF
jgi:hypothetical protein